MLAKRSKIFFAGSLVMLIVAIAMASWGFPRIIDRQLQKSIQIDNSSMTFEKWRKLPVPLKFQIYVFNVTNPEEINEGEKPILSEVGPFVYDEYRERTSISYEENDTIKYMLKKTYFFNKNLSGDLTEDDVVTVINFSYMAAILTVNDMMPSAVGMVNQALEEFFSNLTDPFMRVRVGDLLFDGIYLNCVGQSSALGLVCGKIRAEKPPTMRLSEDGKGFYFSMFSHLNLTESGPYQMVRGTNNINNLGNIVSYQGKTTVSKWNDEYCNQINGSDGTIFPPISDDKVPERIYVFEPDICRSMYVSYVEKRNIFEIPAFYYEMSRMTLAAKSAEPNNKCFCHKNWSGNHDGCLMMGLQNLMPCQGAPAILSYPHFYLASEEVLEYFEEGIHPDKDKHKSYMYLDSVTGVILQGRRRVQLNVELRKFEQVPQLAKVPTGLFPLLWIDEGADLPPAIQKELKEARKMIKYVQIVRWILLALSIVCLLVSSFVVGKSISVIKWPRNANSVSFVMKSGNGNVTNRNKAF